MAVLHLVYEHWIITCILITVTGMSVQMALWPLQRRR